MPSKAMTLASDSLNLDTPVPFTLSPLAFEDFYDIAAYSLTPAGRAEIHLEQTITLTSYLEGLLQAYSEARKAREQARGDALLPAMTAEENASVNLAYAIELAVNRGC